MQALLWTALGIDAALQHVEGVQGWEVAAGVEALFNEVERVRDGVVHPRGLGVQVPMGAPW